MCKLAHFILHMFNLPILLFLVQLDFSKSILNSIQLTLLMLLIVDVERSHEVDDLVAVLDWVDPPVVDNEFELRDLTITVSDFGVLIEGLTHDSNQHVEQMDTHKKCDQKEQKFEDDSH